MDHKIIKFDDTEFEEYDFITIEALFRKITPIFMKSQYLISLFLINKLLNISLIIKINLYVKNKPLCVNHSVKLYKKT